MESSSPLCLRRLRVKPEDCAPAELFAQWRDALGEVFEVRATPAEIAGLVLLLSRALMVTSKSVV